MRHRYVVEMGEVVLTFKKKKEVDEVVDEFILSKPSVDLKIYQRAAKDTFNLVAKFDGHRKIGF